jgi:ribosomal protein S18 acetylase RimI-like enzyme
MPDPTTTVTIRYAVREDADQMARLHLAAWRAAYRGLLPDDFLASLDYGVSTRRWMAALTEAAAVRSTVRHLVAQDGGGAVAGMCTVGAPRQETLAGIGELRMLNVHPQWWGTGVAAALLVRAESEMAAMGYHDAYLWVLEGNARARRFYRRQGWVESDDRRADERISGAPIELRYLRSLP